MYCTGQKNHSIHAHSFEVSNPEFTGEITSQHAGLELVFSLDQRRSKAAKLVLRNKVFSLAHSSSILAYNPQEAHRELFHAKGQTVEAIVFSVPALTNILGQNFDHKNYVFDRVQTTDQDFSSKIKSLYQVLRNNDLDDWTVGGLSEGFITYIFSHFDSAQGKRLRTDSTKVARALATYLSTNFQDQGCWLGEAEEKFGVTKFHLIRSFKAEYKKTPHQFLTEIRINYAAEQLRAKREKIIEIAFRSGFAELSTFNKCFKRKFGCSPRRFVKL